MNAVKDSYTQCFEEDAKSSFESEMFTDLSSSPAEESAIIERTMKVSENFQFASFVGA